MEDPRTMGETLKGSKLGEFWKYRFAHYSIITRIEDERLLILVLPIGHPGEVYSRYTDHVNKTGIYFTLSQCSASPASHEAGEAVVGNGGKNQLCQHFVILLCSTL